MTKKVEFRALEDKHGNRDGSGGYAVYVDNEQVIEFIDDFHMGNCEFDELWNKLNIELEFDYELRY